jgi:Uncharacterized conserved protein
MGTQNIFHFRIKTQFENLGDALINRELIALLSRHGRVVVDATHAPAEFVETVIGSQDKPPLVVRQGPSFFLRIFWRCLVLRLTRAPGTVWLALNPGGNSGEISAATATKRRLRDLALRTLRLAGCKIALIGASFDNLGPRHAQRVAALSKIATLFSVRDSISAQYCEQSGIRVTDIVPDLAFNLGGATAASDRKPPADRAIAISMRKVPSGQLEARILQALAQLDPDRASLVHLCFQVKRDEEPQQRLRDFLANHGYRAEMADVSRSIRETVEFYSRCELVITNRLHVLLLAAHSGTLPMAYLEPDEGPKIRGILRDAGLETLVVEDIETFRATSADTERIRIEMQRQRAILEQKFSELFG